MSLAPYVLYIEAVSQFRDITLEVFDWQINEQMDQLSEVSISRLTLLVWLKM